MNGERLLSLSGEFLPSFRKINKYGVDLHLKQTENHSLPLEYFEKPNSISIATAKANQCHPYGNTKLIEQMSSYSSAMS